MSTIKIGGPGVYNAGQYAHELHIARVGSGDKVSAVFDVHSFGGPGSRIKFVANQIDESQASEIIDALEEAFPDLAPHVEEPQQVVITVSTVSFNPVTKEVVFK